jgi:hypothetical protein
MNNKISQLQNIAQQEMNEKNELRTWTCKLQIS